ncbi:MAG TPA: YceH family protein [Candidatus Acidoferrum sp.]|nr:YceH family protein [Candidatus Acidoferrum sp.]
MALQYSENEIRVLGCLIEKEITTPEYYPLSLNALLNACNQKSNRDPVFSLNEAAVRQAVRTLADQALIRGAGSDSRVAKYEHRMNELYNFHRHEIAVLCVLLLRGPQTPGELRTRTERLYEFEDLEAVHSALNHLMRRDPPLVKILPRQPGTKESRYMHLFAGEEGSIEQIEDKESTRSSISEGSSAAADRVSQLEVEVDALRRELGTLREQLANFQKQFQ